MKVAVIGTGPGGLLAAKAFGDLGVSVVLFGRKPAGGGVRRMAQMIPEYSIAQDLPAVGSYWKEVLSPLARQWEDCLQAVDVVRIQKCFLRPGESPPGMGRLGDLFRVVYRQGTSLERFEDVDIVIEAAGPFVAPHGASASGLALNEERGKLLRSWQALEYARKARPRDGAIIVGDGPWAGLLLSELWQRGVERIALVSWQSTPFSCSGTSVEDILRQNEQEQRLRGQRHQEELRRWEALESFEKAKIPRPECDSSRLAIYSGYNVISIDKLEDRKEIFVTLERPAFRGEERIKTLSADALLVATGFSCTSKLAMGLQADEPGFFVLERGNLPRMIKQIQGIKEWALQHFSPRELS